MRCCTTGPHPPWTTSSPNSKGKLHRRLAVSLVFLVLRFPEPARRSRVALPGEPSWGAGRVNNLFDGSPRGLVEAPQIRSPEVCVAQEYDSPWKEALHVYFPQFLELLFPEVHQAIDWSLGWQVMETELLSPAAATASTFRL